MIRTTKVFSVCLFLLALFSNGNYLCGQSTYEIGPFVAIGFGQTEETAEESAWEEVWDIVAVMATVIPQGHKIVDIAVEYQGPATINTYMLEFHLVVAFQSSPSGGGPGDPGRPGI